MKPKRGCAASVRAAAFVCAIASTILSGCGAHDDIPARARAALAPPAAAVAGPGTRTYVKQAGQFYSGVTSLADAFVANATSTTATVAVNNGLPAFTGAAGEERSFLVAGRGDHGRVEYTLRYWN